MENQQNQTKNWAIGVLVVIVLVVGYLALKKPAATSPTPTNLPVGSTTVSGSCLTTQEAWNHIGETACVQYHVASPYQSGKSNVFLNEKADYKNGFTVTIFSNSLSNFSGSPVSTYGNKTIQATGLLKMYQGHPEIIVNGPSQIVVVK